MCRAEIGRGGFGVVYRADQPDLGRQVAVKVLQGSATDEHAYDRFQRECRALGSVGNHPNIATVYGCGMTAEGDGYLVMELLEGGSLADRTAADPLPWRDVAATGVALAGALESAHRVGVLHRDITPANVMFDALGTPKLLDFGVASVPGALVTGTRSVSLTLAHAAPEVLAGSRGTAASDIYALASTLFAAIHGLPAFVRQGEETLVPLLARIASEPVPDLREQGVPDDLCQVLEQALAKDPARRPLSAEELGVLLAGVVATHGGPTLVPPVLAPGTDASALVPPARSRQEGTVAVVPAATPTAHRRGRRVIAVAGTALVGLALLTAMLWQQRTPEAAALARKAPPTGGSSSPSAPSEPPTQSAPSPSAQPESDRSTKPPAVPGRAATIVVTVSAAPRTKGATLTAPRKHAVANPAGTPAPTQGPTTPAPTPAAPAAPVVATVATSQVRTGSVQVEVSWSAAAGGGEVERYQVQRTLVSGRAPVSGPVRRGAPAAVTSLFLQVPVVTDPNKWYRWQVRAVGPGGKSAWLRISATLADLVGLPRAVALQTVRATGMRARIKATTLIAPAPQNRGRVAAQSLPAASYPGRTMVVLTVPRPS